MVYDPLCGDFYFHTDRTKLVKKFKHFKIKEKFAAKKLGKSLLNRIKQARVFVEKDIDVSIKRTQKVKLVLENKIDGVWYRLSYKIPEGWRVREIRRADGKLITNRVYGDRSTGIVQEINWWIEKGVLYFIDDPIYGYDITLSPPAPNDSVLLEVPYQDDYHAGGLSAIVFPYNGGAPASSDDHTGGVYDGGLGQNIDDYAGAKISLRVDGVGYGNAYANGTKVLGTYKTVLNSRTYTDINTTPSGELESVIETVIDLENLPDIQITQKLVIRDNNMWFADVFYIKNNSASTTYNNLKFFQGIDWNFQGSFSNDSAYYDTATDTCYGSKASSGLSYGGFKGYFSSDDHGLNNYSSIWQDITNDSLNGATSFSGDAAGALAWTKASLAPGEVWVVPIVWGLGFSKAEMDSAISDGINELYDVGVKSIDSPEDGAYLNPLSSPTVTISATAALFGIVDQWDLPVYIRIQGPPGFTPIDTQMGTVNLEVPDQETASISYDWDISSVPTGDYTITVYTNLANDSDTSNDSVSITVHVVKVTLEPSESELTADPGVSVQHTFTIYNNGGSDEIFEISIGASSMGWASRLIYQANQIATDLDGNGAWEWVDPAYDADNDSLPEIPVTGGGSAQFIIQKDIPADASNGVTDQTTVSAVQVSDPSVAPSSTLKTNTTPPGAAQKQLYLHSGGLLDRNPDTNASSSTTIAGFTDGFWQQSPAFVSDFVITSSAEVHLYIDTGGSTKDITVSLAYTNGTDSGTIGSVTQSVSSDGSTETVFTISVSSSITVPQDYWILLKVKNPTSGNIVVYHDSTHPSHVLLVTTTYVNVQWAYTINQAGVQTDSVPPSTLVVVKARVSDPFGIYDISDAQVRLLDESLSPVFDWTSMSEIESDPNGFWKDYQYSFTAPSTTATYTLEVKGVERNGVTHVYSRNLIVEINPDHLVLTPENSATLVGESKTLTVQVVDPYEAPVPASVNITVNVSGSAIIASTTLSGATGVGTSQVSGSTQSDGSATIEVTDSVAELVVVTPDSSLPGSSSSPDKDSKANVNFLSDAEHKQFYLKDDGTFDATDAQDELTTDAPTGTTLQDFDADGNDGLTIVAGGYDPSQPSQYQEWIAAQALASDFAVRGGTLSLWTASSAADSIILKAELIDWDGSTGVLIASAQLSSSSWHTTWQEDNFDFGNLNYTVPAGHYIMLRVYREDTSPAELYVAYDVDIYPSKIEIATTTFILVEYVDFYDAAYPGGTSKDYFEPGSDVYVRAKVTDPLYNFGDITGAYLTCSELGISDAAMTEVDSGSNYKIFEYLLSSVSSGTYHVSVKGVEKNSVSFTASDSFTCGPDHVRVVATDGEARIGEAEDLTIQLEDSLNNPVSGSFKVTVTVSGSATITATTLQSATGVGTNCVTGYTLADGTATVTITDTVGETVTVTPDGPFPGSQATPDRDVSDTVTFSSPYLQVVKDAMNVTAGTPYSDPSSGRPGERIRFRIVLTNTGTETAYDIVVVDPLPSNMDYVSGSITLDTGTGPVTLTDALDADQGDWDVSNPGCVTVNISSIDAGSSVTITYDGIIR